MPVMEEDVKEQVKKGKKRQAAKKGAKASKNGKPAKAKKAAKASPRERDPNYLSKNQIKLLDCLNKNKSALTRLQMKEKTGIEKGFSKLLGATTKEDLGSGGETGLEARKLVEAHDPPEGERGVRYTITAKGRSAFADAKKKATEKD